MQSTAADGSLLPAQLNRYTLWLGDRLLGAFTERRPVLGDNQRQVGALGTLEPAVPVASLKNIWQIHQPEIGGVVEHAVEPISFGRTGLGLDTSRQVVLLRPMSEKDIREFPEERTLIVKDESGNDVPAMSVKLQRVVVAADVAINSTHRARGLSEEARDIWVVTFTTSGSPA